MTRNRGRREKRTYNVKVYFCKGCDHIFHTTRTGLTNCDKCGGELGIIDRYKSGKPPRTSGKRGKWLVKERDRE